MSVLNLSILYQILISNKKVKKILLIYKDILSLYIKNESVRQLC